jgi:hypothetical protein
LPSLRVHAGEAMLSFHPNILRAKDIPELAHHVI